MDNSHHKQHPVPKRSSSKSIASSDSLGVGQTPTPPPLPVASSAPQGKGIYIVIGVTIGCVTGLDSTLPSAIDPS